MTVKCPLCGFEASSLLSLKSHFYKSHGDVWTFCPLCRRGFKKAINHYFGMYLYCRDVMHGLLWLCMRRGVNSRSSIAGHHVRLLVFTLRSYSGHVDVHSEHLRVRLSQQGLKASPNS